MSDIEKKVPELCQDLERILMNINYKSSILSDLLVPNYPSSSGSNGLSGSKTLIECLKRLIGISWNIENNLQAVIDNVDGKKDT